MDLLRCPSCGEPCKKNAKFCSNCGAALPALPAGHSPGSRPLASFGLSFIAAVGMLAVALSMSFADDAPGDVGSPIAGLFHAVGTVQLFLGLGVLVSALFLVRREVDVEAWGNAILCLGVISIAAQSVIVLEGTFAVIFLALPGALAAVAGLLARRSASAKHSS